MYDLSTNSERQITSNPAIQRNPVISGNYILWEDNRYGNFDIYLYNLLTNNEQRLIANSADQIRPSISGNKVVWYDNRNSSTGTSWDVYYLELGDSSITPTTSTPTPTPTPQIDSDRDGFSDVVENYIGTDPADNCPDNSNDAAWPPDFNNNKTVNIIDVGALRNYFNSVEGDSKYNRRYDLNADKAINIIDVGALNLYFNKTCTP